MTDAHASGGRRGGGNVMDIQTYIVEKPVRVYVIAGYEVEAGYLWEAIDVLKRAKEYMDDGRGTHELDHEAARILIQAGLAKEGARSYWYLPTPEFDTFYAAFVASLDARPSDVKEPEYIWKLETQP